MNGTSVLTRETPQSPLSPPPERMRATDQAEAPERDCATPTADAQPASCQNSETNPAPPKRPHLWTVVYQPRGQRQASAISRAAFLRDFPGFLVAQAVRSLPAVQETRVPSLGREEPVKKEMATHSSTPDLENPTEGGACWAAVHEVAKSRT